MHSIYLLARTPHLTLHYHHFVFLDRHLLADYLIQLPRSVGPQDTTWAIKWISILYILSLTSLLPTSTARYTFPSLGPIKTLPPSWLFSWLESLNGEVSSSEADNFAIFYYNSSLANNEVLKIHISYCSNKFSIRPRSIALHTVIASQTI